MPMARKVVLVEREKEQESNVNDHSEEHQCRSCCYLAGRVYPKTCSWFIRDSSQCLEPIKRKCQQSLASGKVADEALRPWSILLALESICGNAILFLPSFFPQVFLYSEVDFHTTGGQYAPITHIYNLTLLF